MIKFANLGDRPEPQQKKISSAEYIRFCEFCRKNNPHVTVGNCLTRKTGEEDINVPFRL